MILAAGSGVVKVVGADRPGPIAGRDTLTGD